MWVAGLWIWGYRNDEFEKPYGTSVCKRSCTWSEHEEAQHEEAGATGHISAGNATSAVQLQIGKMKYIYIFKIPLDTLLIL